MSATLAPNAIDREELIRSFRQWEVDQAEIDAQLAESMQALVAYQSHLDAWQRQLAEERDELQRMRAAMESDPSAAAGGASGEQLEQINGELVDLRQKVASLTAVLLTRTEELRDLDRQRSEAKNELASVRTREKALADAIAAQQQKFIAEREQFEQQISSLKQQLEQPAAKAATKPASEAARNDGPKPQPAKETSPVLGSLMEQFGKLRQQRSLGRANNSTTR